MTVALNSPLTVSVSVGDSEITFETGRIARQASGAVWTRAGDTVVLATAVGQPKAREGTDFFPLTIDVEEKSYAAGKIPGGFFKREGRSGEKAILTARMIDRPIRPLWPKGYRNDVHCIATVISADMENAHDILAINGISAALMLSPLPFFGPVGAVRVGLIGDELKVNPSMPDMLNSDLDLIVCGTEAAITMVEAGADIVDEATLVEALELAHEAVRKICAAQVELAQKAGKPKWTSQEIIGDFRGRYMERIEQVVKEQGVVAAGDFALNTLVDDASPVITMDSSEEDIEQRMRARMTLALLLEEARLNALKELVRNQFGQLVLDFSNAEQDSKELKSAKKANLLDEVLQKIDLPFPGREDGGSLDSLSSSTVKAAFDAVYKETVRKKIAVDKRRPDGRGEKDIRQITTEVGVAPKTHGSGLFTRGQTQILSLATLGTTKEDQRIDDLSLDTNKSYIHHYNFPPFSVGETGFMRGPKRRDIGHGALAERALIPVIPDLEDFPYTIRMVSETLESNGSSSMGSVCGSALALMDAGVPIKAPVAGIAMGLIMEGEEYVILTDIQGAEDHLGDMDFKVAGTSEGVSALQMDIKITGVTTDLLREALDQAREARLRILELMAETIAEPRAELNENAPRIEVVKISTDQIGMVIGKGGETIRALEEEFSASIGIQEDGTIQIYGVDAASAKGCAEAIESMCKEIEVGEEFSGAVVKTTDFGAFVELKKGVDGLLHISAMGPDRVANVEDVMKRGDVIGVKVTGIDTARGRISLVWVQDQNGKPVEVREGAGDSGPRDRGDRPPRDRERGPRSDRGGERGGRGGGGGGRGGSGGGGGGGRSREGGNRERSSEGSSSSGTRSERGDRGERGDRSPRGEGGDKPRSENGDRPARGEGGERSGGNRSRNRNRSSGGGNREGGNREGGGGERKREPKAVEAPKREEKQAEPQKEGFGRRFKLRIRGNDDE